MLFNSIDFLVFFAVLGTLYFVIAERFRWMLLLFGSYVFYLSWEPAYTILLAALTVFNYFMGLRLGRSFAPKRKRLILILSLLSNGGLLFSFKYLGFFTETLRSILGNFSIASAIPAFSVALPVGISFYTFKIMNYIIDVYRGNKEPEGKFGFFALYVAFFPQLIAGPIDRSTKLLPQFHKGQIFDYQRVTDGLKLMLWGLFQKMVVADNLAIIVNQAYNNPHQYGGSVLTLATILFTFQIYCDFSGYSDIAIGLAQVFGYTSMNNFERPYFSQSVPEFWRRWHISLSTWFRDYLYIPLGGNRISIPRWYINLLIVFLVSGLWHGANWTFVAWGGIHGLFYICSMMTRKVREKLTGLLGLVKMPLLHQGIRIVITFCLVVFAWIFFRANSISDAFYIVSRIFSSIGEQSGPDSVSQLSSFVRAHFFEFAVGVASIVVIEVVHLFQGKGSVRQMIGQRPIWFRWAAYYALTVSILLLGNFGLKQFIYFQF